MTEKSTPEQLQLRVMELEKENESLKSSVEYYLMRLEKYNRLLKGAKGIADGLVTLLDQSTS